MRYWLEQVPSIKHQRDNSVIGLNTHSLRHTFKMILEGEIENTTVINKVTGSGLKGMEIHYQWEEIRQFPKLLNILNKINFSFINGEE